MNRSLTLFIGTSVRNYTTTHSVVDLFVSIYSENLNDFQYLCVLDSTSELVNLTIYAKKSLSKKFVEGKNQREKLY